MRGWLRFLRLDFVCVDLLRFTGSFSLFFLSLRLSLLGIHVELFLEVFLHLEQSEFIRQHVNLLEAEVAVF